MPIEPGCQACVETIVARDDTASALGSGDVDVLGTPRVVALCEQAAVEAIVGQLDEGQTSVGTKIDLDHLAATAKGRRVEARARLERVEGRTLAFVVEVTDDAGTVARGTHTRVIVDRQRFLDVAEDR